MPHKMKVAMALAQKYAIWGYGLQLFVYEGIEFKKSDFIIKN
jgi:hypothetical protein